MPFRSNGNFILSIETGQLYKTVSILKQYPHLQSFWSKKDPENARENHNGFTCLGQKRYKMEYYLVTLRNQGK